MGGVGMCLSMRQIFCSIRHANASCALSLAGGLSARYIQSHGSSSSEVVWYVLWVQTSVGCRVGCVGRCPSMLLWNGAAAGTGVQALPCYWQVGAIAERCVVVVWRSPSQQRAINVTVGPRFSYSCCRPLAKCCPASLSAPCFKHQYQWW